MTCKGNWVPSLWVWEDMPDSVVCDSTHEVLHLRECKVLLCSSSVIIDSLTLCVMSQRCLVSPVPILRIGNFPEVERVSTYRSAYSTEIKKSNKSTSMNWISSCHYRTSGRRANWCNIIIIQYNSLFGQFVNIWCRYLVWSMETNIVKSLQVNLTKLDTRFFKTYFYYCQY